MKATAVSLLALFETKMQLEVPLFQRQYIWQREKHWEPLWEDVARKFSDYLDGRKDAPVHFLGAMVLDLKQTPATHVGKRQVIDGQQRLTTLQIFLAAFRDFCNEHGCEEMAKECASFTLNKGLMANAEVDKFKVWPTQLDRGQFADVISAGSRIEVLKRHPTLQTFGNLTILTQGLNSSVSNSPWSLKKPELLKHSLLPINQLLHDVAVWDEVAIAQRSNALLERALKVWPR